MTKPWWQSKTVWWNVGTTALAIISFMVVQQQTSGLPFNLDPKYLVLVGGVINILLRLVTSKPIEGTGS